MALSINCSLYDSVFVISFTFESNLVTSLPTRTEKFMYFPVVPPKQVNYPSNSSTNIFMIK